MDDSIQRQNPLNPPPVIRRTFIKYIITDMYAKGVQGTKAVDAVKWAETELKTIYEM